LFPWQLWWKLLHAEQSVLPKPPLQPQLCDTQAVPLSHPLVVQSMQAPPLAVLFPQAEGSVPSTQMLVEGSQHPPPLHFE
jgi:hypothetical protein